jgi:hypothetical protein
MSLGMAVWCGCSRRAPSPEQCVQFTEMTFGVQLDDIAMAAGAKATFDRLVVTCLTAPFDRRVFDCAQASHQPMECLRRIQPDLFGDQQFDFALKRDFSRERF